MAIKHGVYVNERATSVSTPIHADVGVPFVIGTAPYWMSALWESRNTYSADPYEVPMILTSWDDYVDKYGHSEETDEYGHFKYTLCEFAYSHFKLYGCQPVIFYAIAPATKAVADEKHTVTGRKVMLPVSAGGTITVKNASATVPSSDYSVYYTDTNLVIELKSGVTSAGELSVSYTQYSYDEKTADDIASGMGAIDACMSELGVIPDLICAPGFSHDSTVAALMATKAAALNGCFRAKALIDAADSVTAYGDVYAWKTENNIVDENQIVCWPKVGLGDKVFHMSTQLAGLMALVDAGNETPYESPSNKNFKMDRLVVGNGVTYRMTKEQGDILNGNGIVTAINMLSSGWVCWGNYTACYPANSDVKDYFISVSRMFDYVANTLIRTFWSRLDMPMNRRLVDNIVDSVNIWLNGLVGAGYLLGGRVEFNESENPLTDLMAGIIRCHIYITPPSPAQEIDFTLEYDVSYLEALFRTEE